MVGLYPSIPHNAGLKALKDALDCKQKKKISTDLLVKKAQFVLTKNYFEFGQKYCIKFLKPLLARKFSPPYAWIFMDKFETNFLKTQKLQPFVWFRYIDDVFLNRESFMVKRNENLMKELNSFRDHIKLTLEPDKEKINFLDVNINFSKCHLMTNV